MGFSTAPLGHATEAARKCCHSTFLDEQTLPSLEMQGLGTQRAEYFVSSSVWSNQDRPLKHFLPSSDPHGAKTSPGHYTGQRLQTNKWPGPKMSGIRPTQCLKEYELVANLENMKDSGYKSRFRVSFEKL